MFDTYPDTDIDLEPEPDPGLPTISTDLLLDHDEVAHAQADATCWWYGALDAFYEHRFFTAIGGPVLLTLTAGASLLGNAYRRAEARRLATPRWHNLGHAPVTITSHRTILRTGTDWITLDHTDALHLASDPYHHWLQITLDNGEPFALTGPTTPYLTEILATLLR